MVRANGGLVRLRIAEAKGVIASFHFKEFKNYSFRTRPPYLGQISET
jgi:hypothetical protein